MRLISRSWCLNTVSKEGWKQCDTLFDCRERTSIDRNEHSRRKYMKHSYPIYTSAITVTLIKAQKGNPDEYGGKAEWMRLSLKSSDWRIWKHLYVKEHQPLYPLNNWLIVTQELDTSLFFQDRRVYQKRTRRLNQKVCDENHGVNRLSMEFRHLIIAMKIWSQTFRRCVLQTMHFSEEKILPNKHWFDLCDYLINTRRVFPDYLEKLA